MAVIKDGWFMCECGCKLCRVTDKLKTETGVVIDCRKCGRKGIEVKKTDETLDKNT